MTKFLQDKYIAKFCQYCQICQKTEVSTKSGLENGHM